jgi:hypothetical protein
LETYIFDIDESKISTQLSLSLSCRVQNWRWVATIGNMAIYDYFFPRLTAIILSHPTTKHGLNMRHKLPFLFFLHHHHKLFKRENNRFKLVVKIHLTQNGWTWSIVNQREIRLLKTAFSLLFCDNLKANTRAKVTSGTKRRPKTTTD